MVTYDLFRRGRGLSEMKANRVHAGLQCRAEHTELERLQGLIGVLPGTQACIRKLHTVQTTMKTAGKKLNIKGGRFLTLSETNLRGRRISPYLPEILALETSFPRIRTSIYPYRTL